MLSGSAFGDPYCAGSWHALGAVVRWLHLPIRPYLGGWTRGSPFDPIFFSTSGAHSIAPFPGAGERWKRNKVEIKRLTGRLKQLQFLKNASYKLDVAADA